MLYLFYSDGETALAACVLRATTKKGRQLSLRKKMHPGDLAGGFSDLEMTGSFTALALPLVLLSVCLFVHAKQLLMTNSYNLVVGMLWCSLKLITFE